MSLRIAFLVGSDSASTRASIEAVCGLSGVTPVAILLDSARSSTAQRLRNLRRNVRREGVGYIGHRVLEMICGVSERLAGTVCSQAAVEATLTAAFPDACFSLADIGAKFGIPVLHAGNLNSAEAAAELARSGADLGIVLGTRVLKRSTFGVPRMGCINLHKGKVPEYRGMPPGFWELYDGAQSAGVTVHFVDDGLDTGDVIAASTIPIHQRETPESLLAKLHLEGSATLARAVSDLAAGTAIRTPQPACTLKPRRQPARRHKRELAARLPHWNLRESDAKRAVKNLLYCAIYYSGFYALVRKLRPNRSAVLLYHRVNDLSQDVLTTSRRRFAEHMVTLRSHYAPISTTSLVERLRSGQPLPDRGVAVHFDDCYRDVYTDAGAILHAAGVSATAFVSSGFVGTARVFAHDAAKYPHRFDNLGGEDLTRWLDLGNEIGAHTVNHVDLGSVDPGTGRTEITDSGRQLEWWIKQPVRFFSFPFGRPENFNSEFRRYVSEAGYVAMFSAHGGFVRRGTDPLEIPRLGACSDLSPLYLMMELEGLTIGNLHGFVKRLPFRSNGSRAALNPGL